MFRIIGRLLASLCLIFVAGAAAEKAARAAAGYNMGGFWRNPIPVFTAPTGNVWSNVNTQVFSGTCLPEDQVQVYVGATLDQTVTCASNGTFSATVTRASDGAYTVTFKGISSGVTSPTSSAIVWTRDTSTPSAPTITSPTTNQNFYGNWLTFTGTCDYASGTGDPNLGSYQVQFLAGGVVTGSTPCQSNGTYSGRMNIYVDGSYGFGTATPFTVRAVDRAGNVTGSVTSTITWTRTSPVTKWVGAHAKEVNFSNSIGSGNPDEGLLGAALSRSNYGITVGTDGYLYVADQGNNRINRYDASTGVYGGSIGYCWQPGGSCISGNQTGWCTGCKYWSYDWNEGSYYSPKDVIFKTVGGVNYLYVLGAQGKIQRVAPSTGAPTGWIGTSYSTPATGGAAGCTTMNPGDFTPGWCFGGDAYYPSSSNGMGAIDSPYFMGSDSNYLYAATYASGKISRYNLVTGAFGGWIGQIGVQPTGPTGSACVTAATGSYTPSWCKGGDSALAATDQGDGRFGGPISVDGDGTYLYISDYTFNRVVKVTAVSGTFVGWTGEVGNVGGFSGPSGYTGPSGFIRAITGPSGCITAVTGSATPGWCQGGQAGADGACSGSGAAYSNLHDLKLAGGFLYGAEYGASRMTKIDPVSGLNLGWMGSVYNVPTGGAVGCTGKTMGDFTPGWCTGGCASTYDNPGTLNYIASPVGVAVSAASGTLYTMEYSGTRVQKRSLSAGTYQGWVGYSATAPTGWTNDTSALTVSYFAGGTPAQGILRDVYSTASDDNYLYAGEYSGGQISRYTAASGAPTGWIGAVWYAPSGGAAGCTSTGYPNEAPGWCLGGAGLGYGPSGTFAGLYGITRSETYLYAANYSCGNVGKYDANTGAFLGAVGRVYQTPIGGATGCTGLNDLDTTPGWCLGGYICEYGSGDGQMNGTISVAAPSGSGFLYVSDYGNQRILKYNSVTGAFIGWIGRVATTPTGGAPGCVGTMPGDSTPGWCTGGTAQYGSGDGAFWNPYGISVGPDGLLYVADYSNYRIERFDPVTGYFKGWLGLVATTPTGGDPGCTTKNPGDFTNGWCFGGASTYGMGAGGLNSPSSVVVGYNGLMYVTDSGDAVQKFNAATGQYQGWKGMIYTVPTGGDPGCTTAAQFTATPGWCTGGQSTTGFSTYGTFHGVYGLSLTDFGYLYLSDAGNYRVYQMAQ